MREHYPDSLPDGLTPSPPSPQALLGRAAALDAAVAGGRGAALAEAALALGASLAGQGASYALGVVADFNSQRGAGDAQQLQLLAEGE